MSEYSELIAPVLLGCCSASIVVALAEKIPTRMLGATQAGEASRMGRCVTGAAAILLAAVTMLTQGVTTQGVALCLLAQGLLTLAVIDWKHCLLPDVLTLPLLWMGLAASTAVTQTEPTDAIYGAIAGYGVLWVIANGFELVSGQQGLGYGDLKLVAMVGAWLGWTAIPGVIFIGATAAFAVGTAQILTRRASRDTPQPFGPYLVASSLLMVFAGPEINHAYLLATGVA